MSPWVFPEMARLEEWSCKGKAKLYFRDFNSEQECEKESRFISLKPPCSRDGDKADVSSCCQPSTGMRHGQKGSRIPPSQGKPITACTGFWHSIKMSGSFFYQKLQE